MDFSNLKEIKTNLLRQSSVGFLLLAFSVISGIVLWLSREQAVNKIKNVDQELLNYYTIVYRDYYRMPLLLTMNRPLSSVCYHNQVGRQCEVLGEQADNSKAKSELSFAPQLAWSQKSPGKTLDAFFLLSVVLSWLALVCSFDTFTADKEAGTLPLIFAQPLSRKQFFLGKLFSRLSIATSPVIFVFLVFWCFNSWNNDFTFVDQGESLFPLGLASVLYIAFFTAAGLWISTCTRTRRGALIAAMLFWAVVVLVYPNLAALIANSAYANEPYSLKAEAFTDDSSRINLEDRLRNQLTAISPLDCFERIAAATAGSNLASVRRFLGEARQFQPAFRKWCQAKQAQSGFSAGGVNTFTSDEQMKRWDNRKPDLSDLPSMPKRPYSVIDALRRELGSLLILAAATLAMVLLGLFQFLRMDLRNAV